MDIRIYQIDMERDEHRVAFESLERTKKYSGREDVDPSIYEQVYTGTVDCRDLEDVYEKFNLYSPPEFRGHSLSKSDVVEIVSSSADAGESKPGFYFCDTFGFKEIEFDPDLTSKRDDLLKVVLLEPGEEARVVEIGPELYDMQHVVRGNIEVVSPFDDNACMICNRDGKLFDLPPNRILYDEEGTTKLDAIAGNCFICGTKGDEFISLTEQQAERYQKMFQTPPDFTLDRDDKQEIRSSLSEAIGAAEGRKNEAPVREDTLPSREGR